MLGYEPIEASIGVVGTLLLWQEQRETIAIREGRPARSNIVPSCRLSAPMQNHDQGGILFKGVRSVGEHAQTARVRSKAEHFLQPTVERFLGGTVADPTSASRAKQFQKSRSAAVETVWRLKLDHVDP